MKTRAVGPCQRQAVQLCQVEAQGVGVGPGAKGALRTLSPLSSLSLWFFFHSCSCPQVILAQNKTKGNLSLKGNGKNGEFKAGCTSPFAEFVGSFAHVAAGAVRASPLLEPLEWNPYTSLSVSAKLQPAAVCTHRTPLGASGGQGSMAAGVGLR